MLYKQGVVHSRFCTNEVAPKLTYNNERLVRELELDSLGGPAHNVRHDTTSCFGDENKEGEHSFHHSHAEIINSISKHLTTAHITYIVVASAEYRVSGIWRVCQEQPGGGDV